MFLHLLIDLRVVSCDVDLVSRSTPQILQSVFRGSRADLNSLPVAELGFVVDRVAMDGGVIGRMGTQLHRDRVRRRRSQRYLGRVWRSYKNK